MKLGILFAFLLYCFAYCETASSQTCLNEILGNKLYSGSDKIINGRKWLYEKKYLGSPLLFEDYWPNADILYNGVNYRQILMNYDLYTNELILYNPEKNKEKYVVINKDLLSGFSFTDSVKNEKRHFEYLEIPDIRGKALYEKISSEKLSAFLKPMKRIEGISSKGQGRFANTWVYFINSGKGFQSFRTKKQFLKLLPDHGAEISRFIRAKKIKINDRHPESIITVLQYYDKLK